MIRTIRATLLLSCFMSMLPSSSFCTCATTRSLQYYQGIALQAYAHKLAQCLLEVESKQDNNDSALLQLQRWSVEVVAWGMTFGFKNTDKLGFMNSLNMEDGTFFQDPPPDDAADAVMVRCLHKSQSRWAHAASSMPKQYSELT